MNAAVNDPNEAADVERMVREASTETSTMPDPTRASRRSRILILFAAIAASWAFVIAVWQLIKALL